MITETEIRENVVDRSGEECPFCECPVDTQNVVKSVSFEYDEEYYGIECPNCRAAYDDDAARWILRTHPEEPDETVEV